jgi:hypothetical protein
VLWQDPRMLTTENYRPCLGLSVIGRGPRGTVRSPLGHLAGGGYRRSQCFIYRLPDRPPRPPPSLSSVLFYSFFPPVGYTRSFRFVCCLLCCVVCWLPPPHVLRSRLDSFFFLPSLLRLVWHWIALLRLRFVDIRLLTCFTTWEN